MAESAVLFLLDKIADFLTKELQLFRPILEEVCHLRSELERIRSILRFADTFEGNNEEVRVWIKQLRDIAHDAEDLLDEYTFLNAHVHGNDIDGYLSKISCCIKNMKSRYRVASDLQTINQRIRHMSAIQRRLNQKQNVAEQGPSSTMAGKMLQLNNRKGAFLLNKSDLVGIDEPKKQLVDWLIKGSTARGVISMCGMGGMGKTTLAMQVYEDIAVKKHFEARIWVTVSLSCKLGDLLKGIVQQLFRQILRKSIPGGIDSMSTDNLKVIIKDSLQSRRYLIVLDDVWHLYEWDALKYALPNNNLGSRVIITTRNGEVASATSKGFEGKVFSLKPLPVKESWDLFCRKTFEGKSCPPYLEEICISILKQCEGLPLAIVAVAGVLATKDKRRIDEWDMISQSLGSEIEKNGKLESLKDILSLSFGDLPYYLKSCLLYLSVFPTDQPIEHTRLTRLWVAEGFIEEKEGRTLEEVAEDYASELLHRNLMQVAKMRNDGRFKTYRIHDILRELIITKSKDQNFATIIDNQNMGWPDRIRRLSIYANISLQNVKQNKLVSQLRSLFVCGGVNEASLKTLFPLSSRFLNVLDLQSVPLTSFPLEIVNMFFLRYLSLRNTKVNSIPPSIRKLQNLETLDLKYSLVTEIPNEILKLQRLRHLLVYHYAFEPYAAWKHGFKLEGNVGTLRLLQKICFIEYEGIMKTQLENLIQLRRLGIIKLKKEDGKTLCSSLEKLIQLRALSITSATESEIIDLQRLSSPPKLLQRLYLTGRLETLPHWVSSLQSLVKLHLKWSKLKDDLFISLQSLPNLVHLELSQAFEGSTLYFKAGGFKKLKLLCLDKFDEIRSVEVEKGAMPCVEKLIIQRCRSLKKVPAGIEHLSKLNVLEFFDMSSELISKLLLEEQDNDFWRVASIPEIYLSFWREGGWDVYSLQSFREREKSGSGRPSTFIRSHELHTRWK